MIKPSDVRNIYSVPASQEQQLIAVCSSVEGMLERMTGRLWVARTDHVFTIRNRQPLDVHYWLDLYPITSTPTLEQRYNTDDADVWTAIDTDDYLIDETQGRIERISVETFEDLVRVTYDGGYTDETTPADVKEVLKVQAAFMIQRHSGDRIVQSSQAFQGGSTTFLSADVHPMFKSFCAARRRYAV